MRHAIALSAKRRSAAATPPPRAAPPELASVTASDAG